MRMKWSVDKNGYAVLGFGKHARKPLWDVPTSYLTWMCNQHADEGDFDENLILEVEEELKDRGEDIPCGG